MQTPATLLCRTFTAPTLASAQRVALLGCIAALAPLLDSARAVDRVFTESIASYTSTELELFPETRTKVEEALKKTAMRRFQLAEGADTASAREWWQREDEHAQTSAAMEGWESSPEPGGAGHPRARAGFDRSLALPWSLG